MTSSNHIFKRFDTSHKSWEKFEATDEKTRKKLGLFETEHIDDPCEIKIAVNPKEYIKKFSSDEINKKLKGLRKGTDDMDIANYGCRIDSVRDIERFVKVQNEHLSQHRFSMKHNDMYLQEAKKCKFAQTNDKRYYFEDGIVSLPFSHPSLLEIVKYKTEKKQKVERYIYLEKKNLLKMEKDALLKSIAFICKGQKSETLIRINVRLTKGKK